MKQTDLDSQQTPLIAEAYDPAYQIDVRQSGTFQAEGKPGSIFSESRVITSFDARPINGQDFISTGGTFDGEPPYPLACYANFTVPQGQIAIVRGFMYEILPLYANIPADNITGQLIVGNPATAAGFNGTQVQGFQNFNLGQAIYDYQPCYVLVDQGQTVSMWLTFSGAYAGLAHTDVTIKFYGNLLLSTGRPLVYEPGFSDPLPVYDQTRKMLKKEQELSVQPVVPTAAKTGASIAIQPFSSPVSAPVESPTYYRRRWFRQG